MRTLWWWIQAPVYVLLILAVLALGAAAVLLREKDYLVWCGGALIAIMFFPWIEGPKSGELSGGFPLWFFRANQRARRGSRVHGRI